MILERRYSSSLIILNSDQSNISSTYSHDSNRIYSKDYILKEQESALLANENKNNFYMNNNNNHQNDVNFVRHNRSNSLKYEGNLNSGKKSTKYPFVL
jgi:hypothetical protein